MKKTAMLVLAMIALGMSSCAEEKTVDELIEVENIVNTIDQAIDSATQQITDTIINQTDSTKTDLIEMVKTEVEGN